MIARFHEAHGHIPTNHAEKTQIPNHRTIDVICSFTHLTNGSINLRAQNTHTFGAHGCDGDDFPVDSTARRFGTGSWPKLGGRLVMDLPNHQSSTVQLL